MKRRLSLARAPALVTILLVLAAPMWAQAACGDCDRDGVFPTILDALRAATFGAGLALPTPADVAACDVRSPPGIDVLDALELALASAGLPASLVCGRPSCAFVRPQPGANYWNCCTASRQILELDVDDPDGDPVDVTFEASTDGGLSWFLLTGCDDTNPMLGVSTPAPALPYGWLLDFSSPVPGRLRATVTDGTSATRCVVSGVGFSLPGGPVCGGCVTGGRVAILIDRGVTMSAVTLTTPIPGNPTPTPFEMAKYQAKQLIDQLTCDQYLHLGAFDTSPVLWQPLPVLVTHANRVAAKLWIDQLNPSASGSTYGTAVAAVTSMVPMWLEPGAVALLADGQPTGGYSEVGAVTAAVQATPGTPTVEVWDLGGTCCLPLQIMQDIATATWGGFTLIP